jgi:LysM repeat protein
MNTSNPFNPPSSLQEQKNKTRARFRLAVFVALGVAVIAIVPMLVQGCKREEPNPAPTVDTNPPPAMVDTNLASASNLPPALPPLTMPSNGAPTVVVPPPLAPVTPAVTPAAGGNEYTVVHGDSFYTIAKKNGVSMKAVEDANPGVDPKKLKVGQKLSLPASAAAAGSAPAAAAAPEETDNSAAAYTVKSGDTLTRIAKTHGTTVKALKAENSLTTDRIKVGQKLKIPVKETTPTPTAAPEALVAPSPAPVGVPPAPVPAPNPTTQPTQ